MVGGSLMADLATSRPPDNQTDAAAPSGPRSKNRCTLPLGVFELHSARQLRRLIYSPFAGECHRRGAEPAPSVPDRLVTDVDAALEEQILNVAQRQREADRRAVRPAQIHAYPQK